MWCIVHVLFCSLFWWLFFLCLGVATGRWKLFLLRREWTGSHREAGACSRRSIWTTGYLISPKSFSKGIFVRFVHFSFYHVKKSGKLSFLLVQKFSSILPKVARRSLKVAQSFSIKVFYIYYLSENSTHVWRSIFTFFSTPLFDDIFLLGVNSRAGRPKRRWHGVPELPSVRQSASCGGRLATQFRCESLKRR